MPLQLIIDRYMPISETHKVESLTGRPERLTSYHPAGQSWGALSAPPVGSAYMPTFENQKV